MQELVQKFGLETFTQATEQILDHGERLARARLASLPKGTWSAEDWVDDDGVDKDTMLKIKATVTISEDEFLVDFSGSSNAVKGTGQYTYRPDHGCRSAYLQSDYYPGCTGQ